MIDHWNTRFTDSFARKKSVYRQGGNALYLCEIINS